MYSLQPQSQNLNKKISILTYISILAIVNNRNGLDEAGADSPNCEVVTAVKSVHTIR